MNERQRRFCEAYAACGNAAQAAREAGYSEKTARSQGQRLSTDVDILKYVRELQDETATARIASMKQVKAFWSDVMHDPTEKTADRLRAGELLARSAGAFVHRSADDGEDIAVNGEFDGEDVVIYLPAIERDNEMTGYNNERNEVITLDDCPIHK